MKAITGGMRHFDADKVAYFEKENWAAYYQKQWLRLFRVSIQMVRHSFVLPWPAALRGAYFVARAEMAAAPKDNDIHLAEGYMRRFYQLVKERHGESFDVEEAARLEVKWWVVHRRLFGHSDSEELVDALAALYAAVYGVDKGRVRAAAYHRAQAMVHSDRWVQEVRSEPSPLLDKVEAELRLSYRMLRQSVDGPVATRRVEVAAWQ
jgi:hypothetical protein